MVLLDFWTYSCGNCIDTLPYVHSWYNKYRAQGLVIIGVHTPEYSFEKDSASLQTAIKRTRLRRTTTMQHGKPSAMTIGRRST